MYSLLASLPWFWSESDLSNTPSEEKELSVHSSSVSLMITKNSASVPKTPSCHMGLFLRWIIWHGGNGHSHLFSCSGKFQGRAEMPPAVRHLQDNYSGKGHGTLIAYVWRVSVINFKSRPPEGRRGGFYLGYFFITVIKTMMQSSLGRRGFVGLRNASHWVTAL